jgi:hypothetical protein
MSSAHIIEQTNEFAVIFASFLYGGFTTMEVINQTESKVAKRTSVECE